MTTAPPPCVHWDKIPMPHGPVSKGVCLKCGREKLYVTSYGYQYNNKPKERDEEA